MLSEILQNPVDFLYVFASDKFVNKLQQPYRARVWAKRANQRQLLNAEAGGSSNYQNAVNQLRAKFIEYYGYEPVEILNRLAKGENVCGKDWTKGVYGIGEVDPNGTTSYIQPSSNGLSTTAPVAALPNGNFVTYDSNNKVSTVKGTPIYGTTSNGESTVIAMSANINGVTYTSAKASNGYFGAHAQNIGGTNYTSSGSKMSAADQAAIWEGVALCLNNICNWLLDMFGDSTRTTITAANTEPDQLSDGWVTEEASVLPLVLAAGGAIALSGGFSKFWKSAKKSK